VVAKNDPTEGKEKTLDAKPYYDKFIEAMDDDFNTPRALGVLFDLAREINQAGEQGLGFSDAQNVLSTFMRDVFGIRRRDVVINAPTLHLTLTMLAPTVVIGEQPTPEAEARVSRLIKERNRLRKAKQWQKSDEIRTKLGELGVVLEDASDKTNVVWKHTPAIEPLDKLLTELGITP
jgi:cysteinyl-tRNA synthetase